MAKYFDEILGDLLLKDFLPTHPMKKGLYKTNHNKNIKQLIDSKNNQQFI